MGMADWEDTPPLRILHYRGKRRNAPDEKGTYKDLFSVTLEKKGGEWVVTKYDVNVLKQSSVFGLQPLTISLQYVIFGSSALQSQINFLRFVK